MTDIKRSVIIADAGPLIHLDELYCLDILRDYPEVLIPQTVWNEVKHHRPQIVRRTDLPLVVVTQFDVAATVLAVTPLYTLHQGETEALMLCVQYSHSTLLTDDTAARLAAQSLGIISRGTLGLLLRAIRRGTRSKEQVLQVLKAIPQQSTLHIRPSLLADVIRQVQESH